MKRILLLALAMTSLAYADEQPKRTFAAPRRPGVPQIRNPKSESRNPVDRFIVSHLEKAKLAASPETDRATLLRRVSYDLTGLPPTPEAVEAAQNDKQEGWYERAVERLLASSAFGERMAQPWLDLVRYAESDGYNEDAHRPAAHRYRDWVIRAFNDDMPYDRFVHLQLAGDELEPNNPDAVIAAGYLRLPPYEWNAANLEHRWQDYLDDVTDVTGQVFLGLTVGCARCHDHKYDPTTQKDYFALQSFLAAVLPRDDVVLLPPEEKQKYEKELAAWEKATSSVRDEMEKLLAPLRSNARKTTLTRFREEIQQAVLTPEDKRTPYQVQIVYFAERQLSRAENEVVKKLPADKKKRYAELEAKLKALPPKPHAPEPVMTVSDVGQVAPPTHRLMGGNWKNPREVVQPYFPEFLGKTDLASKIPSKEITTGRRSILARWMTRADHPMTARVMVNRLWQHHFGVGLVASSNDFGVAGDLPTHPELLDWLACELIDSGWSLKHVHRLMVLSATYRQSSHVDPSNANHQKALAVDRENKLLWHQRRRRLDGEALRDTILHLSGELNRRMMGVSAKPKLPDGISKYAWKPEANEADQQRRSIYVMAKRNLRYPLFDVFDLPDQHNSCARRMQTTTAPQALLLLNGELTLERASRWADNLRKKNGDDRTALVANAYRAAWGRPATADEVKLGLDFLRRQSESLKANGSARDPHSAALVDFCHAIVNSNETLYID